MPVEGLVDEGLRLCQGGGGGRTLRHQKLLGRLEGLRLDGIDWLIAGGESGPGARPAHPDWFRELRYECGVAGVPFFFKQFRRPARTLLGSRDGDRAGRQ